MSFDLSKLLLRHREKTFRKSFSCQIHVANQLQIHHVPSKDRSFWLCAQLQTCVFYMLCVFLLRGGSVFGFAVFASRSLTAQPLKFRVIVVKRNLPCAKDTATQWASCHSSPWMWIKHSGRGAGGAVGPRTDCWSTQQ